MRDASGGPARLAPPPGGPNSLRALRGLLREEVLSGRLPPGDLPARYSAAADSYLRDLLRRAAGDEPSGLALLAAGSYGRQELAPGSDLDLIFLHRKKTPATEVAERLFYELWDSTISIDHSVRTPEEAVALARVDLKVVLGLLDGRVVAGDVALGERVLGAARQLWETHRRELLPRLASAARERHEAFGELAFLLEPDLKDSAGGLRDIDALDALAAALPAMAGLLAPPELAARRALLVSVRVALQARTANRSNKLLLQEQDDVAALLEMADADELAAALARTGREVSWALEDGFRRATAALEGPARRGASQSAALGDDLYLEDGEIVWHPTRGRQASPGAVLSLAVAAARQARPMAPRSLEQLAEARSGLPEPWPEPLREQFVSLLGYGPAAVGVIERLERYGLFSWLLPEWRSVDHRPQRNAYHRYTVDRHLLETVAEATRLVREVERPDLLLMGALLHDIGKGQGGDHSETGRALTGSVARRMGFSSRDVAVLERVVKRHLLLADTAARRDIDDDETIELVAEQVGDRLTLELLAALTKADSLATGPTAWSNWKEALVSGLVKNVVDLFEKRPVERLPLYSPSQALLARAASGAVAVELSGNSLTVLAPDRPGLFSDVSGALALAGVEIRRAVLSSGPLSESGRRMALEHFELAENGLADLDRASLEETIESVVAGGVPLAARLADLDEAYRRYRRPTSASAAEVVVLVDEVASAQASLIEVRAADSRGLLHRLSAVIAQGGLDVVSARIATLGHEVVDSFYVRDPLSGERPSPERLASLRQALVRAAQA